MSKQFEWTPELIKEFVLYYNSLKAPIFGVDPIKDQINLFMKSKTRQPQYRIVSVRHRPSGNVVHQFDVAFVKGHQSYEVHSVERLSDGAVFTVGDTLDKSIDDYATIDAIWLDYNGNQVWLSTNAMQRYGCALSVAEKARSFLLKTDDGVEITNPDHFVYYVSQYKIRERKAKNSLHLDNKRFFSRRAAQEYIRDNKPLFSIVEILSCFSDSFHPKEWLNDKLISMAEEKLQP